MARDSPSIARELRHVQLLRKHLLTSTSSSNGYTISLSDTLFQEALALLAAAQTSRGVSQAAAYVRRLAIEDVFASIRFPRHRGNHSGGDELMQIDRWSSKGRRKRSDSGIE